MHKAKELPKPEAVVGPLPEADAKYHVTTQKRPLQVYAKMGRDDVDTTGMGVEPFG